MTCFLEREVFVDPSLPNGQLRAARQALRLGISEVAYAWGMEPAKLSSIEQGKRRPSRQTLWRYVLELGVTPSVLHEIPAPQKHTVTYREIKGIEKIRKQYETDEFEQQLHTLCAEGVTRAEMARRTGRSRVGVEKALRRLGYRETIVWVREEKRIDAKLLGSF